MGLLADILRENRAQERRQKAAEQVRGLVGSAGTVDDRGSGLLANPDDVGNRMKFATGLLQIPGYEGIGGSMINAIQNRDMQRQQFAERMAQDQGQFEQRGAVQADQFNRSLAQARQLAEARMAGGGSKPLTIAESKPLTIAESKTIEAQNKELDMLLQSGNNAQWLAGSLQEHGTEYFDIGTGGRASEMKTVRNDLLQYMASLNEMGVLDQAEYERLNEIYPDVSGPITGTFTSNESLAAPYRSLSARIGGEYKDKLLRMYRLGIPITGKQHQRMLEQAVAAERASVRGK